MKKIFKTIVALSAASAMMLSTTAMAAPVTVTKYAAGLTTVTSKIDNLTPESMVTYLAVKGEDAAVNDDGSNIVYIGQKTVDSTKTATFSYDVKGDIGKGTYATIKYGSNVDDVSGSKNYITVGEVTVTINGDPGSAVVTGSKLVGNGSTTSLVIEAASGYEIIDIDVNGTNYNDGQKTIEADADDTIVITTAETGVAAVYQLVGAKVDNTPVDGVYTNSAVVRVVGTLDELYFTFSDGSGIYKMDDETEKFSVGGISSSGYYGVEIEDIKDISSYTATAYATAGGSPVEIATIQ